QLLRSSECMQLLKASMSCSIENSSRRMIFIVLDEDALLHEADPTLKAVVNNSVTLRWKEILFWRKFVYLLPKRNQDSPTDNEYEPLVQNEC
ncbi:protein toll, partial [Caerostris extrusa]